MRVNSWILIITVACVRGPCIRTAPTSSLLIIEVSVNFSGYECRPTSTQSFSQSIDQSTCEAGAGALKLGFHVAETLFAAPWISKVAQRINFGSWHGRKRQFNLTSHDLVGIWDPPCHPQLLNASAYLSYRRSHRHADLLPDLHGSLVMSIREPSALDRTCFLFLSLALFAFWLVRITITSSHFNLSLIHI